MATGLGWLTAILGQAKWPTTASLAIYAWAQMPNPVILKFLALKFVFKHEIRGHWPFWPGPIWPSAIWVISHLSAMQHNSSKCHQPYINRYEHKIGRQCTPPRIEMLEPLQMESDITRLPEWRKWFCSLAFMFSPIYLRLEDVPPNPTELNLDLRWARSVRLMSAFYNLPPLPVHDVLPDKETCKF